MKRKPLAQLCCLWAWLAMFGGNFSHSVVAGDMTLIEAGDLFVTPKLLIGKKVGGGGVLCLDQIQCVVENPLSSALFMKFDKRLTKLEDKHRLAKECYQLLCSEFLMGTLTRDGFQTTISYASQDLLPSQTWAPASFSQRDMSAWHGMLLRWKAY